MEIPYGYCQCGCGKKTTIAKYNMPREGYVKGEPKKFFYNHSGRKQPSGDNAYKWKGGIKVAENRVWLYVSKGSVGRTEYILRTVKIATEILGKSLPKGTIIHHINGITDDDRNNNLVICENAGYHFLLHRRKRAYEACGHASWRKCFVCKKHDRAEKLYVSKCGNNIFHRKCLREHRKLKKEGMK